MMRSSRSAMCVLTPLCWAAAAAAGDVEPPPDDEPLLELDLALLATDLLAVFADKWLALEKRDYIIDRFVNKIQ